MKFHFLSSLLLTASAVFVHSSGCADELSKYNTCISAIDYNSLQTNSEFNIHSMCTKFNSDDCKSFLSDIFVTSTNCDLTNEEERQDALTILNLRIAYLKYCATDDTGATCPVSRYLAEDNSELIAADVHTTESHTHDHDHEHSDSTEQQTHDHTHEHTEATEKQTHEHDHDHEHKDEKTTTAGTAHSHAAFTEDDIKPRKLSEFNGDYQTVYPYFLEGDLADYVVQQAEKNNNTYAEQWDIINQKWNCGISYFYVKDDTISIEYEDGKKVEAKYTPAGVATKKNDKGEISTVRYKFETKSDKAPKYIMLNDHNHEPSNEEITHVHFHFSNISYDDIMTSKLIPFFVQKQYDSDETREVLLGHDGFDETLYAGEEVSTFDDEDVRDRTLSNWNGEWKSPYQALLDGKLDEAFEAKAASKGDKTAAEYKEYYKKGYESDIDSLDIKNNRITFTYINGKEIKAKYEYKGFFIQHWSSGTKAAMYRFENIDEKSEAPRLIELNDHLITRTKPVHFHLRSTNTTWDDIDAENHWPSFFPKSNSIEDIIEEISGVAHKHDEKEDHDHDHDHDHKDEDEEKGVKNRELTDFDGEWKSLYPYILSGQLDDACVLNPGERTYEECVYHYQNNFKTDIVNMIIKDNSITYIYDNGLSATSEYINRGPVIVEWTPGTFSGFYQYEAKDKEANVPKFILLNDHNNGPAKAEHIHLRTGDSFFETVDRENKVWGMFYLQSTPDEEIIASFNGTATNTHSHEGNHNHDEKEEDHDHNHEDGTGEDSVAEDSEDEMPDSVLEAESTSTISNTNGDHDHDHDHDHNHDHDHSQIEHEQSFFNDLMDDCRILECNKRFIALVELLKATGNPEADEFEEFIKYYKKSNCDAIYKLAEVNSGSLPLMKISISFIITILLSVIYLF